MSVKSCEKLEKSIVALTVEVSADDFEAAVNKAYLKARKKISVPGFRPGKATRKIIEGMYGTEVFYSDAVDIALPDAYEAAVEAEKLSVVGYPTVELEGEVTKDGFTFKATVPVYPEVKLGQYKGLSAPKAEVKVTAADVDSRIKELSDRNTRLVSVERPVENGDTAVIDFEGFDNGVAFDGGKGENYPLEIGSGSFIPGFEEQVVGMNVGEEKEINVTFPEDYQKDLAGKAVVFKVKVNEVKVKEAPSLDDEFAKDVSEFDTLKELKADLKKKIAAEREEAATRSFEDALMSKVADGIECDVPDAMVDSQVEKFVENFKSQIQAQGIPYEQYLKMTGSEEQKLKDDAREPAQRQVRLDLAVAAIINEEKLEATDEDVEAEYKNLSEKYSMDVEMVKKYLPREQIEAQVLNEKAIAVVRDSATAEPVEEKKKKAPKKKDEGGEEGGEKPVKKSAKKSAKKEEKEPEPTEEQK
ncbi:trigger factor [Oscillibacter sp. MSJ-2]|uniref:Trigger factor n=1 Tax=Dysosmobacter acutus TaxID=2841504 RepID=A0ABS6F9S7_9FIRM|nr:trigger factor [Dysosmobacter acutus]MBU5627046.1 trigger factor [Dysosmobacter acutus]